MKTVKRIATGGAHPEWTLPCLQLPSLKPPTTSRVLASSAASSVHPHVEMPVLPSSPLANLQLGRDVVGNLSSAASAAANATELPPWEVICAFPVSGQYGLGSRIL